MFLNVSLADNVPKHITSITWDYFFNMYRVYMFTNVCMYICGMWCVVFVCMHMCVLCASEGTWCPSVHVEARGQHCGVSSILTRWCAAQRSKSHHRVVEARSTKATSSAQPPFYSIHTASSIKLQLIGQLRYWPGNSGFPPTAQILHILSAIPIYWWVLWIRAQVFILFGKHFTHWTVSSKQLLK